MTQQKKDKIDFSK